MISTPLPLVEKTSGIYIEEMLPSALSRKLTHSQVAGFCALFRRIGIARLFLTGLPEELFGELSRSGRALLYFLEGAGDDAKVTSKSEPFFDAVACNDAEAAQAIARQSRSTWNTGREYEDDFLYVYFLMSRFALESDRTTLPALLDRWTQLLQGGEDLRLPLCRALLASDQRLFDASLEALVTARERDAQRRIRNEELHPDDAPTTAKLWVELLALLRFADQAGLQTPEHLPLAPSVARRLDRARLPPPDAWRQVRSYRELS
jgi:hypothetical protein